MKKLYALLLLQTCILTFAFAKHSHARFVQNKGQWQADILYKQDFTGGHILFEQDRVVFVMYASPLHEETETHDHHHFEAPSWGNVHVLNFQSRAERVEGEAKYADFYNYYLGNDPTKWAENVPIFERLRYKNVYKGIDAVFEVLDGRLKYSFEVEAGADPNKIQLLYEGLGELFLDEQTDLMLTSEAAWVRELAPVAFQQGKEIPCAFRLKQNIVSFDLPNNYDPTQPLLIDPTMIFSTYTGSTQDNWGFTATYDAAGNAYAGGIIWNGVQGAGGYPTTPGAFQTNYQGGERDVVLTKFDATGNSLIYSTYLGGLQQDQPQSMVVNAADELIVFGVTSSPNFPATANAYDNTQNGGYDIFLAKFSTTGTLLVSTFVGGSGNDGMNGTQLTLTTYQEDFLNYNYSDEARGEVEVDAQDNVYVASCSASPNFPTTPGCFQAASGGGGRDGVLFKMSPSLGALSWASYYGGSNLDAAYGVKIDDNGNVFVTGGTRSSDLPTVAGSVQTTAPGGNTDGFLAKFDANGTSLLAATYIGTSDMDQAYLLQLDKNQNVYVTGQTRGNMPVVNAAYSVAGGKQFISKYNNSLTTLLMQTQYGTANVVKPNLSPTAFLVDVCGNIYVAGWGGNVQNFSAGGTGTTGAGGTTTAGLPLTNGAFQSTTNGSDFHILVLAPNAGSLLYGTYWGGSSSAEHVDGGTSRFDPNGVIYEAVCASCGGYDPLTGGFPTTPGVWSSTNNSTNCNLGLFKIEMGFSGLDANFNPLDSLGGIINVTTTGCAPLNIQFDNLTTGQNPATTTYSWTFGVGTASSTQFSPSFTYTQAGTYTVMLVVTDSSACNPKDTTYRTIIVYPPPAVDAGLPQTLCPGDTAQLQATGTGAFIWTPNNFLSNDSISNPLAFPPSNQTYTVTLTDNNGCKASDQVTISIQNNLTVNAGNDTSVCNLGGALQLQAVANQPNVSYQWSPATGLSNPNISNPTCTLQQSQQTYTVIAASSAGCTAVDSVTVGIFAMNIQATDVQVCMGDSVTLQTNVNTPCTYQWTPATFLSATNQANPVCTPTQNISYTIYVTSNNGCQDTAQMNVTVVPLPTIGINDTSTCNVSNLQLNATISPANSSLSWSPTTGLSNPNIANPVCNITGQQTYTLQATNPQGCSNSKQVSVAMYQVNVVGNNPAVCGGGSMILSSGISGAAAYSWVPATFLSATNVENPTCTSPQTITYTVYVTDVNGCTGSGQVTATVWALPTANAGADIQICEGSTTILQGSGGVLYDWQPPAGLSNNTDPNPLCNASVTTTYTLTVTDTNGCTDTDDMTVAVVGNPTVTANGPFTICQGDTVQLEAYGGQQYEWVENTALSNFNIPNPLAVPPSTTTFIVKGFNQDGCSDTAAVTVTVIPKPKVNITGDHKVCIGEKATLTATGCESYLWDNGSTSQTIVLFPQNSEWISCEGMTGNCKAIPDSLYLTVIKDLPIADFEVSIDSGWAPMTVQFTDATQGSVYKWLWEFGLPIVRTSNEQNPSFTYIHAGNFNVTLIVWDVNNCKDTLTKPLFADNVTLFVPSAFTPNGDGYNDFFEVGFWGIRTLHIDIYDRWGALIFSSDDKNFKWDGSYRNTPCPEGTFVWVARGIGENNKNYEKKGTVTLMR